MKRCLVLLFLVWSWSVPLTVNAQRPSEEVVNDGLGQQVDKYLNELASKGFSGSAFVVRKGKLELLKGYGIANRETKRVVTHDTLFQLASVSKQFTGAAILKLEMKGKLKVSDPITKYFKDVPADKRAITIHHLLTHTSGLPHRVGDCSSRVANLNRDDYVKQILAAELKSPPGETHLYSNDGYGLLGAIVEIASGESFDQYLRKHLFAAAGMKDTGYPLTESDFARSTRGYQGNEEYLGNLHPAFRNAGGPAWCNRASGGLLSSAADMYKWYLAMQGTKVLSESAKVKWFTPHVPETPERTSFYGYGWALFKTARQTNLIAHDGGINDYFTADFRWYKDEDVAVFVAANTAEHTAQTTIRAIVKIIFSA